MKLAWVGVLAVGVVLVSACSGPRVDSVRAPAPGASAPASSAATSSAGAISTPTLVFASVAPQVDIVHLPIGSPIKASDYTVLLTGEHVVSMSFRIGSMRGGGGGSVGLLDLALDKVGTSTMAKWSREHPRSVVTVLVGGRLLAQPVLAKHVSGGRLALVGTNDVAAMGRLVGSIGPR